MPTIAPYDFAGPVEAALFLGDTAVFALAEGSLRLPTKADRVIETHRGGLLAARFDPFAGRLLTAGEDGRVVGTEQTGEQQEIASAGSRWVSAIAGGPKGAVAFATGRIAHVVDGPARREFALPRTAEDVAFAPKGLRLAVARYNGVSLFFAGTDAAPQELEWKGAHNRVLFSPDGRFLVTAMQENALHGWRLDDGKHMRMTGYPAKVKSWSWTAKGKYLATSGAPAAILWPFTGRDGPMGRAPIELGTRGDTMVTSVAAHPSDDVVAIGYADGMILAVRIADAKEALLRRAGQAPVSALGWDRGGRLLAFGTEGGEAGIVDIAS